MPAMNSVTNRIQSIRSRVERYRGLVETLYDQRIAADVARFADELEADLHRLERWQRFSVAPAPTALAS